MHGASLCTAASPDIGGPHSVAGFRLPLYVGLGNSMGLRDAFMQRYSGAAQGRGDGSAHQCMWRAECHGSKRRSGCSCKHSNQLRIIGSWRAPTLYILQTSVHSSQPPHLNIAERCCCLLMSPAHVPSPACFQLLVSCMVGMWTVRLGSYLVKRIHKVGKDSRFDEVKHQPLTFLFFWVMQVRGEKCEEEVWEGVRWCAGCDGWVRHQLLTFCFMHVCG